MEIPATALDVQEDLTRAVEVTGGEFLGEALAGSFFHGANGLEVHPRGGGASQDVLDAGEGTRDFVSVTVVQETEQRRGPAVVELWEPPVELQNVVELPLSDLRVSGFQGDCDAFLAGTAQSVEFTLFE